MTHRRPKHSRVRLVAAFASILLGVVAFTAFSSSSPGMRTLADRPQDGIPGPPEANPLAMNDYVQQLDFGAGAAPDGIFDGDLPCGMPSKCGGKTNVHIRIVPSNYATDANWDSALKSGYGYVVAKVRNADSVPFDRLNLDAGQTAYVWVGNSQGPGRSVTLYDVKGGGVKRLFTFKGHTFCRESAPQKPAVHINTPSKCSDTTPAQASSSMLEASIVPLDAAVRLVKVLGRMIAPPPADSGLWISCSLGCCEAQF